MRLYNICLSLTYFTQYNAFYIHLYCCKCQNSIHSLCIIYHYIYLYHISAFSLSIYIPMGKNYFYLFTIVNHAAINMGYRYLFKIVMLFLSDKYADMKLLDHMSVLFLNFWGISILFSIVLHKLTSSPVGTQVAFSPHPEHHLLFLLFLISILTSVRWYIIVVLICISLMINFLRIIFWSICIPSLENYLNWITIVYDYIDLHLYFYIEIYEFFLYFGY